MRAVKVITLSIVFILFVGCNSDDNGSNDPTNQELLIMGIWYQETTSEGAFSDCEKNTSYDFVDETNLKAEPFDDDSGTCESVGVIDATYSLTNDVDLTINIPGLSVMNATIVSISETLLVIEDEDGQTIALDRNPG